MPTTPTAATMNVTQSLTLDLKTGQVAVIPAGQAPWIEDGGPAALGIIGMVQLEVGVVLVLITKTRRVREE